MEPLEKRMPDPLSILNELLQCELSAERTCRHALEHRTGGLQPATLRALVENHREAADAWRGLIRSRGGDPARDAGVWGAWSEAVRSTVGVFGDAAERNAVRQEEDELVRRYEDALAAGALDREAAALLEREWLPRARRHRELLAGDR